MPATSPLRILHLSDFHFRVGREWENQPILSDLVRALRGMMDEGLVPDLVAMTGDIAFSGKAAEYEMAHAWIEGHLRPALGGIPRGDLLFVPGNHDVDRDCLDQTIRDRQQRLLEGQDQSLVTAALTDRHRGMFTERHQAFLDFANEYWSGPGRLTVPWWSIRRTHGSLSLAFLGLNTAWMSHAEEEQGDLLVGSYQVTEVQKGCEDVLLRVALMHHPYDHVRDFDRAEVEARIQRSCGLVLWGHRHKQRTQQVTDARGTCIQLAAGSVLGGGTWRNGWQLVEIFPETFVVRIHHYVWEDHAWIKDRNVSERGHVGVYSMRPTLPEQSGPAARYDLVSWPRPPQHTNLLSDPGEFFGRGKEIRELCGLLTGDASQVVAVIGAAGTGKTRVSREVGRRLLSHFKGGVWFVDLTEATTVEGVCKAIGAALDVPLTANQPPEDAIANILAFREQILLILDNFEQLVEPASPALARWRLSAREARFLVTSVTPIHQNEVEFDLPPLPVPPRTPGASLAPVYIQEFDSVRLFLDRARRKDRAWVPTAADYPCIAQICADLEGNPLAIEIAAARIKAMTACQIAEKLSTAVLEVLNDPYGEVPGQTLTAAIRLGYDRLSPWQKEVFLKLGTFRGGFSLDAARAVVGTANGPGAPSALDAVHVLLDSNLLVAEGTPAERQYRMILTIRAVCEEEWSRTAGEEERRALERRHGSYYLQYAESWNRRIQGPEVAKALDSIQAAAENVIAAHERAMARGDVDTAARAILALAKTWAIRSPGVRRIARLDQVLRALPDDAVELRTRVLTELSAAHDSHGSQRVARDMAEQAVEVSRVLGDSPHRADALVRYAIMRLRGGDTPGAAAAIEQVLRIAAALRDDRLRCDGLEIKGQMKHHCYNADEVVALCDEADLLAERCEYVLVQAKLRELRGRVLFARGDYSGALAQYDRSLAIMRELSAASLRTLRIEVGRANALDRLERHDEAILAYASAENQALELGNRAYQALVKANRADALMRRGKVPEAFQDTTEAVALYRELEDWQALAINLGNMASQLCEMKLVDDAREKALKAADMMDELGIAQSPPRFVVLAHLARIESAAGDVEKARSYARGAWELAGPLGLASHPDAEIREAMKTVSALLDPPPPAAEEPPPLAGG